MTTRPSVCCCSGPAARPDHTVDAERGPAFIGVNLGTAGERTEMSAEIIPGEARAIALSLLDLAATAEHPGAAARE